MKALRVFMSMSILVTSVVSVSSAFASENVNDSAAVAMFRICGWAIGGLLTGASWTKTGSAPGRAVAKNWDKNKNGWIGFYKRTGFDGAGRIEATQYKTT